MSAPAIDVSPTTWDRRKMHIAIDHHHHTMSTYSYDVSTTGPFPHARIKFWQRTLLRKHRRAHRREARIEKHQARYAR